MAAGQDRRTALHEAGHAVIAFALQRRFTRVAIAEPAKLALLDEPTDEVTTAGFVTLVRGPRAKGLLDFAGMMISLGGMLAEKRLLDSTQQFGAGTRLDLLLGSSGDVVDVAAYVVESLDTADHTRKQLYEIMFEAAADATDRVLTAWWPAVEALATELERQRELDYDQAGRIIADQAPTQWLMDTFRRLVERLSE